MNCDSHHVADLLLYYPQVSIWGQAAQAFRTDDPPTIMANSTWSEDAVLTNTSYAQLKLLLSESRLDYKIADDSYLSESRVQDGVLSISDSRFRTLVLPPMSTMRRNSANRVLEFYESGGTVIALQRLPTTSVEGGRNDPALATLWNSMFDVEPTLARWSVRSNMKNGKAYFVPSSVEDVISLLAEYSAHDVDIVQGPTSNLSVLHKKKDGIDFYWVVNDSAEARTNVLLFRTAGRPERWDVLSGKREPIFYQTLDAGTLVRFCLGPWDASYIVFDPDGPPQPLQLVSTNLDELFVVRASETQVTARGRRVIDKVPAVAEFRKGSKTYRGAYRPADVSQIVLDGDWKVSVDGQRILLPYADTREDPMDEGLRERWFDGGESDARWHRLWLAPMGWALRKWNVIGPFPNPGDLGLEQHYPPEAEHDFRAEYKGDGGRSVHWVAIDNDVHSTPEHAPSGLDWGVVSEELGRYAPDSHVIDYGLPLRLGDPAEGTVFAQTYVYSPESRDAVIVLATRTPYTVYVNMRQVDSRWFRPNGETYGELSDGFAFRISVRLNAGWNTVLLKFLHHSASFSASSTTFACRVELPEGGHVSGLLCSLRPISSERRIVSRGYRWLRFSVPQLACALRVPSLNGPWSAFVDGRAVGSGPEIVFPRGTREVVLRVGAEEILDRPFAFDTAPADMPLGTWSVPGVEHFSGSMTYQKLVHIPEQMLKERVLLDCGKVGVAAELWINDVYAGARPWQPYALDVTTYLHSGLNTFKIHISNTAANARAVGESIGILEKIDQNGWIGPARLVPFLDREIPCIAV